MSGFLHLIKIKLIGLRIIHHYFKKILPRWVLKIQFQSGQLGIHSNTLICCLVFGQRLWQFCTNRGHMTEDTWQPNSPLIGPFNRILCKTSRNSHNSFLQYHLYYCVALDNCLMAKVLYNTYNAYSFQPTEWWGQKQATCICCCKKNISNASCLGEKQLINYSGMMNFTSFLLALLEKKTISGNHIIWPPSQLEEFHTLVIHIMSRWHLQCCVCSSVMNSDAKAPQEVLVILVYFGNEGWGSTGTK